jgi:hypothetical protein
MYYRGISHALLTITRDEGLRGLYKGLGTTLMVSSPNLKISQPTSSYKVSWIMLHLPMEVGVGLRMWHSGSH